MAADASGRPDCSLNRSRGRRSIAARMWAKLAAASWWQCCRSDCCPAWPSSMSAVMVLVSGGGSSSCGWCSLIVGNKNMHRNGNKRRCIGGQAKESWADFDCAPLVKLIIGFCGCFCCCEPLKNHLGKLYMFQVCTNAEYRSGRTSAGFTRASAQPSRAARPSVVRLICSAQLSVLLLLKMIVIISSH